MSEETSEKEDLMRDLLNVPADDVSNFLHALVVGRSPASVIIGSMLGTAFFACETEPGAEIDNIESVLNGPLEFFFSEMRATGEETVGAALEVIAEESRNAMASLEGTDTDTDAA